MEDKEVSKKIQEIMRMFYQTNPSLNFANKTYRKSAEWMIKQAEKKEGGYDYIKRLTQAVIDCQDKEYAPVATNPYEMKEKLLKFKLYFERNNKNKPKIYEG